MKIETHIMVMRFYSQTKKKITQCMKELKNLNICPLTYKINPLTISMNPLLPPGTHYEVSLVFKNEADKFKFYNNKDTFKIYGNYSCGLTKEELKENEVVIDKPHRRQPGDPAFNANNIWKLKAVGKTTY